MGDGETMVRTVRDPSGPTLDIHKDYSATEIYLRNRLSLKQDHMPPKNLHMTQSSELWNEFQLVSRRRAMCHLSPAQVTCVATELRPCRPFFEAGLSQGGQASVGRQFGNTFSREGSILSSRKSLWINTWKSTSGDALQVTFNNRNS